MNYFEYEIYQEFVENLDLHEKGVDFILALDNFVRKLKPKKDWRIWALKENEDLVNFVLKSMVKNKNMKENPLDYLFEEALTMIIGNKVIELRAKEMDKRLKEVESDD